MKKIWITGGTGFIGQNLVESLGRSHTVLAPTHEEVNLLDQSQVRDYLKRERIDYIIHTANTNNTRRQNVSSYDSLSRNLRMYFNLASCKDAYHKMFYFGSGAEYDAAHYIPRMAESYLGTHIPSDPYGLSKYIMSQSSLASQQIYDLTLFGVYGKYEEWERRFISNAICRALKGMPITIQKNVYFDYLWMDDLSRMMEWFLAHDPVYHHYNVCSGTRIDLCSLAYMIREAVGAHCPILVGENGFKQEYTGDNARLLREMGAFSFTDYPSAIESLVQYYTAHLEHIDETRLV